MTPEERTRLERMLRAELGRSQMRFHVENIHRQEQTGQFGGFSSNAFWQQAQSAYAGGEAPTKDQVVADWNARQIQKRGQPLNPNAPALLSLDDGQSWEVTYVFTS